MTASHSALVIIDMQQHVFARASRDADFVVRRICALIDKARRDGEQIIFVQTSDGAPRESEGWRLIAPLKPIYPDWVIERTGGHIFESTHLAAQLKAAGLSRLILAGARVNRSLRAARALGFDAEPAAEDVELA